PLAPPPSIPPTPPRCPSWRRVPPFPDSCCPSCDVIRGEPVQQQLMTPHLGHLYAG
ncbi:hypothetical protein JTE90_027679, partial [Oedothorax gibbosus]